VDEDGVPLTAGRGVHLVGLEPPGNVARDLSHFRESLFRRYGLVSALAMPEVLPLAFGEATPARSSVGTALGADRIQPGKLETTSLFAVGPALYLGVGGPALPWLSSLAASLASGQGPFPIGLGFFLAILEEPGPPDAPLPESEEPPRLAWAVSTIIDLSLRYADSQRWWSFLECETVWSVQLRRAP